MLRVPRHLEKLKLSCLSVHFVEDQVCTLLENIRKQAGLNILKVRAPHLFWFSSTGTTVHGDGEARCNLAGGVVWCGHTTHTGSDVA